jgi:hypothetical protein
MNYLSTERIIKAIKESKGEKTSGISVQCGVVTVSLYVITGLRGYFEQEGCPICSISSERVELYYKWFFIENYNSLATMERLLKGGFCRYHSLKITEHPNNNYVSTTYSYLLKGYYNDLADLKKGWKQDKFNPPFYARLKEKISEFLKGYQKNKRACPACRIFDSSGEFVADVMAKTIMKDKGFWEQYINSQSVLCREHFDMVIKNLDNSYVDSFIDSQMEKVKQVQALLDEFFRKLDYRFSHEPKGEEQTAWRRAVKIFDGHY